MHLVVLLQALKLLSRLGGFGTQCVQSSPGGNRSINDDINTISNTNINSDTNINIKVHIINSALHFMVCF